MGTTGRVAAQEDNFVQNILVVDDDRPTCVILSKWLEREGFGCQVAFSGDEALQKLAEESYALLVSDIEMPGISGIDLLSKVKEYYEDLAVIMVTGLDDREIATQTLELGAFGYVIKPFERNELLINVANALRLRRLEMENRRHRDNLERKVLERTAELRAAQAKVRKSSEETIMRLAKAAEFRDDETAQHTVRMSHYCGQIAEKTGFSAEQCDLIRMASALHDVGKIGTPDNILLKPGALTSEEFDIIKQHTDIGYRILSSSDSELLDMAATIAWTHHEKYDGSGYPRGLVGDAIPVEGRIAAVCDVFDALTTNRVYKKAFSVEKAVDILEESKGKHFDPHILDLFLDSMDAVLHIRHEFSDPDQL